MSECKIDRLQDKEARCRVQCPLDLHSDLNLASGGIRTNQPANMSAPAANGDFSRTVASKGVITSLCGANDGWSVQTAIGRCTETSRHLSQSSTCARDNTPPPWWSAPAAIGRSDMTSECEGVQSSNEGDDNWSAQTTKGSCAATRTYPYMPSGISWVYQPPACRSASVATRSCSRTSADTGTISLPQEGGDAIVGSSGYYPNSITVKPTPPHRWRSCHCRNCHHLI